MLRDIHKLFSARVLLLITIAIFAYAIRALNQNWDQNQHLHPDERFLTMVTEAMKLPGTWAEYVHPKLSTMNPVNVGHTFFVYGVFPLTITKITAMAVNADTYGLIPFVGRTLSAFFDTVTVLCVFWFAVLVRRLLLRVNHHTSRLWPYWAGFMYAILVLPIQQSHFYTTDSFANTFTFAAFVLFSHTFVRIVQGEYLGVKHVVWGVLGGCLYGLALASKVNALYAVFFVAIPAILTACVILWRGTRLRMLMVFVFISLIATYVSLRLANPYYFETSNFGDPRLNTRFLKSIRDLQALNTPEAWFPPGVQWIGKTKIVFPLTNLVVFGIGVPLALLVGVGIVEKVRFIVHVVRREKVLHETRVAVLGFFIGVAVWCGGFFLYQGSQFNPTMRYFYILYPLLAVCAALGVEVIVRKLRHLSPKIRLGGLILLLIAITIWPLMFIRIYLQPHSRVTASAWMLENIASDAKVGLEHWDDPLPLRLPQYAGKVIEGVELPVFGEDTDEKWRQMKEKFNTIDYYVLSSNRAWGSISEAGDRFPRQKEFYRALFAGETQFTHHKTFSSFPGVCVPFTHWCVEYNDQWAEEAFTVYDHPQVIIFKNTAR
jgi:hypothetical protein